MPVLPLALAVGAVLAVAVAVPAVRSLRGRVRRAELALKLSRAQAHELRSAARALIAASLESPAAVRATLDAAARQIEPAIDVVLVYDRDGDALRCVHAGGTRAEFYLGQRCALDAPASPVAHAALERHRVPSRGLLAPAVPGDRAFVALPLVGEERAEAVFYAASRSVDVLEAEEALSTLVDVGASAYRLARQRERDRAEVTTDALTGALTARRFREALVAACGEAARHAQARLALLFIDTDNFKQCNDALGHAAGDTVLRTLVELFREMAGPGALIGRNGGDEFCVLLADAGKAGAVRCAEAIRARVERFDFATLLGVPGVERPITTSIGVATYPLDADAPHALLELADAAMYHSKRTGRNRVAFFDAAGQPATSEERAAGV